MKRYGTSGKDCKSTTNGWWFQTGRDCKLHIRINEGIAPFLIGTTMLLKHTIAKLIACIAIVFVTISSLSAQKIFAKIEFPENGRVEDVQLINFNDSIFLSYRVPDMANEFQSKLILPDGTVEFIKANELAGQLICGVTTLSRQQKNFYFLEQKRNTVILKVLQLDFKNKFRSLLPEQVILNGKFLGAHEEQGDLLIYTTEKNKFTIKMTRLHNLTSLEERNYKLSVDLSNYKNTDIAFFEENEFLGAVKAAGKVKIILKARTIDILIDEPHNEYEEQERMYKTTFISIDKESGESTIKMFPEFEKTNFRSFISDQYLFRTKNTFEKLVLQVFDHTTGQQVLTKTILFEKTLNRKLVYFREGRGNKVSKIESLGHMIKVSYMCSPFVTVSKDSSSSNFIMTWGTYYDDNGMQAAVSSNPLLGLMIVAVGTAIRQLSDGPGISRYFYLTGNPANGFDFASDAIVNTIKEKIDLYEMDQQGLKINFWYKGYFDLNRNVMAVYQISSGKLFVVKFNKQH